MVTHSVAPDPHTAGWSARVLGAYGHSRMRRILAGDMTCLYRPVTNVRRQLRGLSAPCGPGRTQERGL